MNKDRIWSIAILIAIVVAIGINYLIGSNAVEGQSVGEVSDKYATLVTPAGYAFSIWGLIYTGLVAYGVYQLLPAQLANPRLRRIRPYVLVNALLNGAWIFLFTRVWIGWSVLVILGMLLTLILIHHGLRIGREAVTLVEAWTTRLPFSLYFGWVTVATILNVAVFLRYTGWDGGDVRPTTWALALVGVGLLIGFFVEKRFRNWWYLLPLAWAFAAIAVEQEATPLVAGGAAMASFAVVARGITRYLPTVRHVEGERQEAGIS